MNEVKWFLFLVLVTVVYQADAAEYCKDDSNKYCSDYCCEENFGYFKTEKCCSDCSKSVHGNKCYVHPASEILSTGIIIAIVIGILALIGIVAGIIACCFCCRSGTRGRVIGNRPTMQTTSAAVVVSQQQNQPYPQAQASYPVQYAYNNTGYSGQPPPYKPPPYNPYSAEPPPYPTAN